MDVAAGTVADHIVLVAQVALLFQIFRGLPNDRVRRQHFQLMAWDAYVTRLLQRNLFERMYRMPLEASTSSPTPFVHPSSLITAMRNQLDLLVRS